MRWVPETQYPMPVNAVIVPAKLFPAQTALLQIGSNSPMQRCYLLSLGRLEDKMTHLAQYAPFLLQTPNKRRFSKDASWCDAKSNLPAMLLETTISPLWNNAQKLHISRNWNCWCTAQLCQICLQMVQRSLCSVLFVLPYDDWPRSRLLIFPITGTISWWQASASGQTGHAVTGQVSQFWICIWAILPPGLCIAVQMSPIRRQPLHRHHSKHHTWRDSEGWIVEAAPDGVADTAKWSQWVQFLVRSPSDVFCQLQHQDSCAGYLLSKCQTNPGSCCILPRPNWLSCCNYWRFHCFLRIHCQCCWVMQCGSNLLIGCIYSDSGETANVCMYKSYQSAPWLAMIG